MKKILSVLLTVCVLAGIFSAAMPAFAAKADANRKTTVIVEFAGDGELCAAAKGADVEAARENAAQTRRSTVKAMEKEADVRVLYTYSQVLNGVAIETREGDLDALRHTDGVISVVETGGVKPSREVAAAGEISSGAMIGLEDARAAGLDGTGTAIAVIDGGFDVGHETMRLTDESKAKYTMADIAAVIASHEMNSDKITANAVYRNAKIPFAFDYCDNDTEMDDYHNAAPDHGTHVSGIAAGNSGALTGVAPEAQVLMFKIDVYDDEMFLANMLAAIDDAAKFDIASINISAGMDFEIVENPAYELLRKAVRNARAAGILFCVSAGNGGHMDSLIHMPDNSVDGIPNGFEGATSVASVDNIYLSEKIGAFPEAIYYDGDKQIEVVGAGLMQFPETTTVVPMGSRKAEGDLTGKTALLYLDQKSYKKPIQAILESDAVGVILGLDAYINMSWGNEYELLNDLALALPVLVVNDLDAYRLLHAADKTIRVENGDGFYAEPADSLRVSDYSSWGVSDGGEMSVDIAAPGGVIYSAVPENQYDVYDGTSMASPHIAGAGALLEQLLADKAPSLTGKEKADLKESLLMSTADPIPLADAFASPRVAGAGLVDLSRAIRANAVLLGKDGTTALNIGDKLGDSFTFKFQVKNFSATDVRYNCNLSADLFTDGYTAEKVFNNKTGIYEYEYYITDEPLPLQAAVQSDLPRSFTLRPGESRTVTVSVQLDGAQAEELADVFVNGYFVEGYVTLTDSAGKEETLNAPLLGFSADWDAVPALDIFAKEGYSPYFDVLRNLRELRFVLTDRDGKVVAEDTDEYVSRDYWPYYPGELVDFTGVKDGKYTLTLYAKPMGSETEQTFTIREYVVDNHAPKILRVQTKRNPDGSGTLSVTVREPDLNYVQIVGGSVVNCTFEDVYPVDGYDHIDKNGNYVYVLHEDKLPLGWFVLTAYDFNENSGRYGIYSPLALLVQIIRHPQEFLSKIMYRIFEIVYGD